MLVLVWIGALNDRLGTIGFLVISIFVASWIISAASYRLRGYDRLDASTG